jgi:membrane dipeptidase
MFIIDAHLDLAMNAMEWNRDLRLPVKDIRAREVGMDDKPDRGKGTVSLPALRKGGIGLVVATQIARYVAPGNQLPGWHSPEQAWAQTQGQLAWYREMEAQGEMVMIRDAHSLSNHVKTWLNQEPGSGKAVGYLLSLEGADSLVTIDHLHRAFNDGLRAVGPAHYGPGRYANGTDSTGRLNKEGITLLKEMEQLNMILDATHLCGDAFWHAMDLYHGPVWASHNNCRALVNHNRQFSDDQLKVLVEKGAVIGASLDAWMMVPAWTRGVSTPRGTDCNLEKMTDHINHICQLAGDSLHVGIGTDLDGAFGKEQCPYDLETIADLHLISPLLEQKGFTPVDIENIFHGNFLRFLEQHLPQP